MFAALRGHAPRGGRFVFALTALFVLPGGLSAQTSPLNEPDRFAWEVFARVNKPTTDTKFHWPERTADWETWALAPRVYADPNRAPDWDASRRPDDAARFESMPLQQFALAEQDRKRDRSRPLVESLRDRQGGAQFVPPTADETDEVRMNRAAFDYVVTKGLYNAEGQEAMFEAKEKVDFPLDSMEVKAVWRKIKDGERAQFHTIALDRAGTKEYWGLVALHLTTKDLPNWFWATWEHTGPYNKQRETVLPSRDRFGVDPGKSGPSEKLKKLLIIAGLAKEGEDSPWYHYALRGSQVDFVSSTGRTVVLANSIVEEGFQSSSSCITCHARATIGARKRRSNDINRLAIFESTDPPRGSIGRPDPHWFGNPETDPPSEEFWQMDFVWSTFRAKRKGTGSAAPSTPAGFTSGPFQGKYHYEAFRNDPNAVLQGFPPNITPTEFMKWMNATVPVLADTVEETGYVLGEATIDFSKMTIGGSGWSLKLSGLTQGQARLDEAIPVFPFTTPVIPYVVFDAIGTKGTAQEGWHYCYIGLHVPGWKDGQKQQDVLVGSVIRVTPHGQRKAGVVGSFQAVRRPE